MPLSNTKKQVSFLRATHRQTKAKYEIDYNYDKHTKNTMEAIVKKSNQIKKLN